MKLRDRVYMTPGIIRLTIISLLTLLLLWPITDSVLTQNAAKKPIRKAGLINALKELRKGDSQAGIVEQVRQRGVDFELTPAIENELRAAGASSGTIEAVRANYRRPVPSPTPKPTPRTGTVIKNQLGMEFVYVPAGTFMMGSTDAEVRVTYEDAKHYAANADVEWFTDEKPKHQVTIKEGFYMGRYEVTQAQWQSVMGTSLREREKEEAVRLKQEKISPPTDEGDNYAMYDVKWQEAQEFIRRLNARNDGYTYRLPSEAEWEYAARGGTTTTYFWGEDIIQACLYANVPDQALKDKTLQMNWNIPSIGCRDGYSFTAPVGSFKPNNFGLYDMIGNVREWCEDSYEINYDKAPANGSAWISGKADTLTSRVVRGGSYINYIWSLRPAKRAWDRGDSPFFALDIGFRLVAVARE